MELIVTNHRNGKYFKHILQLKLYPRVHVNNGTRVGYDLGIAKLEKN